jgi:hypothetical protein
MGWVNPRWGSLIGPDADTLRAIFESLSEWTNNPSFGYATNPTISGAGVQVMPAALVVKNEWIQSANFATGSAGWQIKANGDAEFNNIAIRGTFRTALPPNARIEIGTEEINRIDFYSGNGLESDPAWIIQEYAFNRSTTVLISGANPSDGRAYMEMNSGPDGGGYPNFHFSFTGNDVVSDRSGDFHFFMGQNGIARFYGNGNAERFLVDDFGTITTGSHEAGDAAMGTWAGAGGHAKFCHKDRWAANELGLFQRNDGQVWIGSGTDTITFEHNGRNWIGNFDSNGFHSPAFNCNKWNTRGPTQDVITFTQTSGIPHTFVDAGNSQGYQFYVAHPYNYVLMYMKEGGGGHDWRVHNLPVLGGTILRRAGSGQIGPESSSLDTKKNVKDLTGDNPIWKVKPKRFFWDEKKVANGKDINKRLEKLGGMAGLIAEEVGAAMPDAVHVDEDGKPVSLEHLTIQGYMLAALHELKAEIAELKKVK